MKDKRLHFLKFALFLGFFTFLIFSAKAANAATLYFSPSSSDFTVGNILNASVLVNTQGQAINNSSAVINFPTGLLEVISVSKSGSIFSLWVEGPAFSNSAGTISFDGGLPTPGYNGSAGRLLNITFRVRNAGTASLVFSSGVVRANDGYGTDILQTRGQAQFNLISEEKPVAPPPPVLGTPQAPGISSLTHPDPNKWYALKDAKFTWELPSGITGARLLVGRIPNAVPTVTYIPAISSKELDNLDDGIWYFSVQLRNNAGWGAVSRFRFQIDTEKPEYFNLTEQTREDATYPKVAFAVDSTDVTSGIDHYEFQVDEKEAVVWRDDGGHAYETSPLAPGKHLLTAKAVDKAGNYLVDSAVFIVEGIKSPTLIDYPGTVKTGEPFLVKGTTYPEGAVTLWSQQDKEDVQQTTATANNEGTFTFAFEKGFKDPGNYKLWAEVADKRGARSLPTEKISLRVERPALIKFGSWATTALAVLVPITALLLLLAGIIWYAWYQFRRWRKKIRKEVREAEQALHKAIAILKRDLAEQVGMLEYAKSKRQLTEEEEKIIKQLKKDLDEVEKFVKKEIKDIEKRVG